MEIGLGNFAKHRILPTPIDSAYMLSGIIRPRFTWVTNEVVL
ncbi:MAG: hypothetical protein V1724_03485 [Chloroflexota bacterium]